IARTGGAGSAVDGHAGARDFCRSKPASGIQPATKASTAARPTTGATLFTRRGYGAGARLAHAGIRCYAEYLFTGAAPRVTGLCSPNHARIHLFCSTDAPAFGAAVP